MFKLIYHDVTIHQQKNSGFWLINQIQKLMFSQIKQWTKTESPTLLKSKEELVQALIRAIPPHLIKIQTTN